MHRYSFWVFWPSLAWAKITHSKTDIDKPKAQPNELCKLQRIYKTEVSKGSEGGITRINAHGSMASSKSLQVHETALAPLATRRVSPPARPHVVSALDPRMICLVL